MADRGWMIVLNEPSQFYTFSGVRGESDVDIMLMHEMHGGVLFQMAADE